MSASITPSPTRRISRVLAFLPAYLIAFCFVANGALTGMFAGARCSGQSMRSLAAGAACVRANTHEAALWAVAGLAIVVLAHLIGRRRPR